MYEFKEMPTVVNDEYVTKQEFNETLTEIKESLAALAPKRAESVQTTNF